MSAQADSAAATPVAAYIGLGSNLGDPLWQLTVAVRRLAELPVSQLTGLSAFYRNPALSAPGLAAQPDFVNAVAELRTHLSAERLLAALHRIEARQQRRRDPQQRWGPRTLDLDLLLYGELCTTSAQLQVPHPRLTERPFALYPLAEIAPTALIPGQGRAAELAAHLDRSTLVRLPAPACSLPDRNRSGGERSVGCSTEPEYDQLL
ncbi:2-amino-4-hydroxy-6-hydroxymethyldihydropteridine diphosphokinase [Halorhodospira abdelmalekii]|uniref:2-amino-4-hydroxy-6- hydroxymethyldihydropteridine diphosphokinase n=1 Tax=Halorhodospira abdelmalekii TaxID=421629 RepID=UPI001908628F|nr:2-amino-4-hydroxy-6-hydroxymethyldihydropteridine diphosphokinase [Halorhodospira abdelmalekii]MBK1734805.1 2-amino-4-hydroxy-6-hydroxymethyldihydropteridine diphosphokinase [Halorhodospira abdelmalekii]